MPLGEFFRTRIFEPLGMQDTTFGVTPEQAQRLSTSYGIAEDGKQYVEDHPSNSRWLDASRFQSVDGFVSTADDYLAFARMLLKRGRLQGSDRITGRDFCRTNGSI